MRPTVTMRKALADLGNGLGKLMTAQLRNSKFQV